MNDIPEQKWTKMLSSIISLETIVNKGGFDTDLISGWTDEIGETFKTELGYALSPFKNELIAAFNIALEPFLPAIQAVAVTIGETIKLAFSAWEAIFTGNWDSFFLEMQKLAKKIPLLRDIKNAIVEGQSMLAAQLYEKRVIELTGMTYKELSEQATAGGVYSGQFDLSPEDIEKILNMDLNLGDFGG